MLRGQRDVIFAGVYDPRRRATFSHWGPALQRAFHQLGEAAIFDLEPMFFGVIGVATPPPDPVAHASAAVMDGYLTTPEELLLAGAEELEHALKVQFERDGPDFVGGLRGAFSLACWDAADGRGVLARDQLGQRPLFIAERDDRLFFASELRPLLELLPTRPAPDPMAIAGYLAPSISREQLILYRGIRRLGHGDLVDIANGRWTVRPYWRPVFRGSRDGSSAVIAAEAREQIQNAVARHTRGIAACGVFLSGGLDSTAIAALAVERFRREGRELRGYSALFPHVEPVDESAQIAAVVTHLGLPITRMSVYAGSSLSGLLETLDRWSYPELTANGFFMRPLGERAIQEGMDVVIGGEGGDEVFAAPEYAISDFLARGKLRTTAQLIARFPNIAYHPGRRVRLQLLRSFGIYPLLPPRLHSRLIRRTERDNIPAHVSRKWVSPLLDMVDPQPWRNLDGPQWWSWRADGYTRRGSMIGAAELILRSARLRRMIHRHPLLDLDVVEWALQVPPIESFDPARTRPVLRRAMEGLLPDSIRLQPHKVTFDAVRGYSLQGDLKVIDRLIGGRDARIRAYADMDVVGALLRQVPRTWPELSTWSGHVWRLTTIECWLRLQENANFARELRDRGALQGFWRDFDP